MTSLALHAREVGGQGCGVPFRFRSFGLRCVRFRSFGPCCIHSTCYPPCEQWLADMVAGALVGGASFRSFRSFLYIRPLLHSLCGVRSCILPSPHRRVTWLLAPVIHPASSGSQGWGQVLGYVVFARVSSPPLAVVWHGR
jgi:hypothetical protein